MPDKTERRLTLDAIFKHLTSVPDGASPIESMRSATETFSRNEVGSGLDHCQRLEVEFDGVKADWLIPPGDESSHRIVYVHGGGWCAGSRQSHRALAAEIAYRSGHTVLLPEYALAPEFPFPAGLNDVVTSFDYAVKYGPSGSAPAKSVAIIGDSAGGNLAAAYTIKAKIDGLRMPDQLVLISPFLSINGLEPDFKDEGVQDPVVSVEGVLGAAMMYGAAPSDTNPLINPGDAKAVLVGGFPSTLIHASGAELLRNQSVRFAKKLWSQSVDAKLSIWPDMPHVWHVFMETLHEADEALTEISAFLKSN